MTLRVLVAGIGNIFLGDDAFGVEVVQRLAARTLSEGVRVADFGIRGFDLAYALMEEHDLAILVDALPRGGQPGTLYVLEPDLERLEELELQVDNHGMDPVKALRLVQAMGGRPGRVLVVGCEPEALDADEEGRMGLSAPVQAAVEEAVELVESLIASELEAGGDVSSRLSQQAPADSRPEAIVRVGMHPSVGPQRSNEVR